MEFKKALEALQRADQSGDQLSGLKAQKTLIISFMSEPGLESKDLASLMGSLSKVTSEIVKLEGLRRDFTEDEEVDFSDEEIFRKVLGKGGVGL